MTLSVLDNAIIQGLLYGSAVVGLILSFRILRYPDLSADGSFLIGAVAFAVSVRAHVPWGLGLLLAALAGAACGGLTGLFHYGTRVNKLLSGVLSSMVCYSVGFRLLGSRPTVGLSDAPTLLSWAEQFDQAYLPGAGFHPALVALMVLVTAINVGAFGALLQSEWGLMLRAVGRNPALIEGLGRRAGLYEVAGLVCANLMVGVSGALVASHQQFVDVNMAVGLVVTLAAAMVLGEHLTSALGFDGRRSLAVLFSSGVVGMIAYYLLYLIVLRASVLGWLGVRFEPSDIKMLSALVLAAGSALSFRRSRQSIELFPL